MYMDLSAVTQALATSGLDYCRSLYMGPPLESVWKLQRVQTMAKQLLTGASRFQHITPVLHVLHTGER